MRKRDRSCTTPTRNPLLGRRALTVLMLAAIVVLALTGSAVALTFTDVPDNHPYRVAITDLASRQIINGFADGSFKPDASVTRQQFAKMIVKTLGIAVTGTEVCPFPMSTPRPTLSTPTIRPSTWRCARPTASPRARRLPHLTRAGTSPGSSS